MEDNGALEESRGQQKWKPGQGGFRATIFIYVLTGFENMGFTANMSSLFLYFNFVMFFDGSTSANTLTNFLASAFLFSIIGGFISDTYFSRFTTCLISGILEVAALMMITYQAHFPNMRPKAPCGKSQCVHGGQAIFFYASLYLYALGAGGVRGSVPALGGDQFNSKNPKEAKSLASYFNGYLFSSTIGAALGVTVIVKIGMDKGWDIAFFICMLAAFTGFVVIAIGKPFYCVRPQGNSPILSIAQVIVVAFRNRKLTLPRETGQLYDLDDNQAPEDNEKIQITSQFRFLDKAAILPPQEDGAAPRPWQVCTITQVEEVKILTRMMPIIASTTLMNTCLAQLQTFSVQQGSTMNKNLGSFVVPVPSIPVIPLCFLCILLPIYEFAFIPLVRKVTHHPSGITQLQRVGVGLVLSVISMIVAGIIEVKRRNQDIKDHSHPISLFWLSFQYGIFGIADMFTLVGLLDFFYQEAPTSMKSLSTSFTSLSLSIGYFLSSVLVSVVNSITANFTKHKRGWLAGTINDNRLELFYWLLATLSCLNFANYLFWASWYRNKQRISDFDQLKANETKIVESPSSPHQSHIPTPCQMEQGHGIEKAHIDGAHTSKDDDKNHPDK